MSIGDPKKNIRWLGHSGFHIKEKPVVYINPYDLAFPEIGELILITQDQKDKCSPDDVKWLRKGSTIIIVPEECQDKFEGDIRLVKAGDVLNVKGAAIEVMPACMISNNQAESEGNGVGYNITFPNGLRIYHTGYTKLTSAMKLGMTDVLLIPFGSALALDSTEVAEIVNTIQPKFVVPMDWDKKNVDECEFEKIKTLINSSLIIQKPKR